MQPSLKERLGGVLGGLSPRARQWATVSAIGAAAVGVLWFAFSLGGDDPARRSAAAGGKAELKPTNVDIEAPGSQVKDSEVWIGKAGRELERYKNDREEQRRINRERQEGEDALKRRFAELEARLKAPPPETPLPVLAPKPLPEPPRPPAPAPNLPPALPQVPARPSGYPPENALPRPAGMAPFGIAAQPTLVRVTVTAPARVSDANSDGNSNAARTLDTFLPVSFTRGVLLGGLDAPTGGQSQGNPHPVLIRLSDNSVLPNQFRAEYRECFVIAAGYGDISSERAYLRTESLSCVRPDGQALELKIQGSVYGEDGKVGMRGRLVTKQGQMLANALMAGVISGIGQGISTANTSYSTSAFGTVSSTSGSDAMKAGLGSGVGRALDRLAQYYIKLAEQTFPIIEIDAGREIDVVITKGARIEGSDTTKAAATSAPYLGKPADRTLKVSDDEE